MASLYEDVVYLSDKGTLMVFGTSGTCKSKFALAVLDSFLNNTKEGNALYIDTEGNIHDLEVPTSPRVDYKIVTSFDDMYEKATTIRKKYKLIILDSFGAPILGEYGQLNMKDKGVVLLKGEVMSHVLGVYARKNNALVLVINQPVSDFNKTEGQVLWPFGDKMVYYYQEVWRTTTVRADTVKHVANVSAFRSRLFGTGTRLFKLEVTDDEISCEKVFTPPKKRSIVYKG